jgi:K+-transporting ATPase ATPase A chain
MARVYEGKPCGLDRALGWLERGIYRVAGINPQEEMGWRKYAVSVLLFSGICFLGVYVILRFQGILPLNPQGFPANTPDLAFNTAASFATNTNWQSYGGE